MSRVLHLRVRWSGEVDGLTYCYFLTSWQDFVLLWQQRLVTDRYLSAFNPHIKKSFHPRIAVLLDTGKESPPPCFELDEM